MLLLFLDTETTGLNPKEAKIMEIAGIIVNFDEKTLRLHVVSEYESFIALESELSPKIQQITGISAKDVENAPTRKIVQENWHKWLENQDIKGVIGHSIHFDMSFLEAEGWWLPLVPIIDTLDLAKILYPMERALNLEHLKNSRNLTTIYTTLFTTLLPLHSHRAMPDTQISVCLFVDIIQTIQSPYMFDILGNAFIREFIPFRSIFFFSQDYPENQKVKTPSTSPVSWDGIIRESWDIQMTRIVAQYPAKDIINTLQRIIDTTLPKDSKIALFSCISALFYKYINPDTKIHIHAYGGKQWKLVQSFFALFPTKKPTPKLETTLENLFTDSLHYTQIEYRSATVLEYLELLLEMIYDDSTTATQIKSLISSIDFLTFYIQSAAHNGIVPLDKDTPQNTTIREKCISIAEQTRSCIAHLSKYTDAEKLVQIVIQSTIQSLDLQRRVFESFSCLNTLTIQNGSIYASITDISSLQQLIPVKYPKHSVKTYLKNEEIALIESWFDIQLPRDMLNIQEVDAEVQFLREEDEWKKLSLISQPTLILTGINKLFLKYQEVLLENSYRPICIYGETASKTKITSILGEGKKPLVLCRQRDSTWLEPFLKLFDQIILAGLPYLQIPHLLTRQWGIDWEERMISLRRLLLLSLSRSLVQQSQSIITVWL